MRRFLLKIWRYAFPLRCDWCDFTSRTAQGIGRHKSRCKAAQLSLPSGPTGGLP